VNLRDVWIDDPASYAGVADVREHDVVLQAIRAPAGCAEEWEANARCGPFDDALRRTTTTEARGLPSREAAVAAFDALADAAVAIYVAAGEGSGEG
jgi:hypothetical protein